MPENKPDRTPAEKKKVPVEPPPQRNLGPQLIGALVGGFVLWAIAGAGNNLGWFDVNTVTMALWGGVIGGLIGGNEALASAGKRLTKKDNPALNTIVALIGMAVIFGFIFGLSMLVNNFVISMGWGD